MSLVNSLSRIYSGLAIPTPIYADANDSPIDLRKKVAIRRQRKFEYGYSDEDDDDEDQDQPIAQALRNPVASGLWYGHVRNGLPSTAANPYLLPLGELRPLLSEQYGIPYALLSSPEISRVVPVPLVHPHRAFSPRHEVENKDYVYRKHANHHQQHYVHRLERNNHHHYPHSQHADTYLQKYHPLERHHDRQEDVYRIAPPRIPSPRYERSIKNDYRQAHVYDMSRKQTRQVSHEREYPTNGRAESETEDSQSTIMRRFNSPAGNSDISYRNGVTTRIPSRIRSSSCSEGKKEHRNYRFHSGYNSDSEISVNRRSPRGAVPKGHIERKMTNGATHKPPSPKENLDRKKEIFRSNSSPKSQNTLLSLLVGTAKNDVSRTDPMAQNKKKGIDILLQQLRENPPNPDFRQWRVYEYYNHLVERSSKQRLGDYIPRGNFVENALFNDSDDVAGQQRKRPSRALTGKHVKHGTGASPSTLITLRQKIQERQKAKELMLIHGKSEGIGKAVSYLSKKPKLGNFKIKHSTSSPSLYPMPKFRS